MNATTIQTANSPLSLTITGPLLYKVSDVVKMLRMSRAYIYKQIKAGRLRIVKEGNSTFVTAAALAEYVALLEREARQDNEMPAALRAATAAPLPAIAAPASPARTRAAGGISDPAVLLAANLRRVAEAPKGSRRRTLYGAARGVARMVNAGAITTADAIAALTEAGGRADQAPRAIREAITGAFKAEGAAAE